jgi:hypothetical protein
MIPMIRNGTRTTLEMRSPRFPARRRGRPCGRSGPSPGQGSCSVGSAVIEFHSWIRSERRAVHGGGRDEPEDLEPAEPGPMTSMNRTNHRCPRGPRWAAGSSAPDTIDCRAGAPRAPDRQRLTSPTRPDRMPSRSEQASRAPEARERERELTALRLRAVSQSRATSGRRMAKVLGARTRSARRSA